jgi:hypothetical protein
MDVCRSALKLGTLHMRTPRDQPPSATPVGQARAPMRKSTGKTRSPGQPGGQCSVRWDIQILAQPDLGPGFHPPEPTSLLMLLFLCGFARFCVPPGGPAPTVPPPPSILLRVVKHTNRSKGHLLEDLSQGSVTRHDTREHLSRRKPEAGPVAWIQLQRTFPRHLRPIHRAQPWTPGDGLAQLSLSKPHAWVGVESTNP